MHSVYEQAVQFFRDDGWLIRVDGDSILRTSCRGLHGEWGCSAHILTEPARVVVYSEFSFLVSHRKRASVVDYLTRANYGLIIGNFDMDMDNGHVRYKTSLAAGDSAEFAVLFRTLVYTNVRMMDKYMPGLMAVLYEGTAPSAAIEWVEAGEPVRAL